MFNDDSSASDYTATSMQYAVRLMARSTSMGLMLCVVKKDVRAGDAVRVRKYVHVNYAPLATCYVHCV